MNPATKDEIARITAFAFCGHVGEPYAGIHRAVRNWKEAEKKESSSHWERITNACGNRFHSRVELALDGWSNDTASEVRSLLLPAMDRLALYVAEHTSSLSLPARISGILYYAVLEYHYREHVTPFFFYPLLLPIFEAGRIPCGWTGKRPSIAIERGEFDVMPPGSLFIL